MTVTGKDAKGTTAERLPGVAAALFRRKGYASTSTREIAGELGISKAALYYHAASKQDILYALSMRALDHIFDEVQAALARETDQQRRLPALIHAHVTAVLAERDLHATMLMEISQLDGVHRKDVVRLRDRYERLVRDVVAQSQNAGSVRIDWEAKELTLALLNLLNWTIFWWEPDGGMDAPRVSALVSTVFLDGVAPK